MKKRNGFTLVELLAVIVILAIILVIAVPQILDVVTTARIGSMESSVKMIAAAAEKEFALREVTEEDKFTAGSSEACATFVTLSSTDYGDCTVTFDADGNATVDLEGATGGKFDGYTCDGTATEAECSK